MPLDIVLYALIALGLVLWLRSLLGMRQDSDRQRPNPFAESEAAIQARMKTRGDTGNPQATAPSLPRPGLLPDGTIDVKAGLTKTMGVRDEAVAGLTAIMAADKNFSTAHFLNGAQDAFVMIVEAFAGAERETLRPLLDAPLYAAFEGAIAAREEKGEKASVEIHAVRQAEILSASLDNRMATVTVRFVADEINAVHDKGGKLVAGHPDRASETIDLWTFQRDIRDRSPGWLLIATREEANAAKDPAVVPDGGPTPV